MPRVFSRSTLTPLRAAALLAAMSVGGLVLGQSLRPHSTSPAATGNLSSQRESGGAATSMHSSSAQVAQAIVATHVPSRAAVVLLAPLASQREQNADAGQGTASGHAAHHDHQPGSGHDHGGHGGHGD